MESSTFNVAQPFCYLIHGKIEFDLSLYSPEEQSHAMPVWSKEQINNLILQNQILKEERYEMSKTAVQYATAIVELNNKVAELEAENESLGLALENSGNRHIYEAPEGMCFMPVGSVEKMETMTAENTELKNKVSMLESEHL